MLRDDCINFDIVEIIRGDSKTDVLGRVEDITTIFGENVFSEILCAHVLEHFYPEGGKKLIQDCHTILKPGGKLILEAPDIQGIIELYNEKHNYYMSKGGIKQVISDIFGCRVHKWKELGWHHWMYTKNSAAELVKSCGFKVTFKGIGFMHGMGKRDFRVVGVKL